MSNEYKNWIEDMRNSEWDSEDHNRYLYTFYKFIRVESHTDDFENPHTQMVNMPIGWRKSFGMDFLNEVAYVLNKKVVANNEEKYSFRITCIKEKFGELRVYTNLHFKELDNVFEKYRKLSRITCAHCGAPATKITTDWITPFCDSCIPKWKNGKEYDNVNIEEYWKKWDSLCQP